MNRHLEFLGQWKQTNDEVGDKREETNQPGESNARNESEADVRQGDSDGGQCSAKSPVPSRMMDMNGDEIVYQSTGSGDFVPSNCSLNIVQPLCVYSESETDNTSRKFPLFPTATAKSKNSLDETLLNFKEFSPRADMDTIHSPLFTHESLLPRALSPRQAGSSMNLFSPTCSLRNINVPSPSFTRNSSQSRISLRTMEGSQSKLYEYYLSDTDFEPIDISDMSTLSP